MTELVCNLNVFTPEQRQRHQALWQQLEDSRQSMEELADGYAFQYPVDMLLMVAAYVNGERRCCPFFRFTLEVEPEAASLWLKLTGTAEVKRFLQHEIGLPKA